MKFRHIAAVSALTAVFLFSQTSASALVKQAEIVNMIPVDKKDETLKTAVDGPGNLYAMSAVLMDADTGRVLYGKEEDTPRPNASTTKVLTCILALENAPGDDYVTVSANAASQPDVKLNMKEGEQYYLEDLLYSLMLKSHNDTAVAIAEHIGGTVEHFAGMMNAKAREIGCTDTHFITPNGLDATDSTGTHHTTAKDLALIMRYAIKNKVFLHITQTRDYSFKDLSKKRSFSLHNSNALLDMMDGVLSGKTGYTGNAGYCYVCACTQEGKTFIISLLGCGWPNHKTYKWSDTKTLFAYGEDHYEYKDYWEEPMAKQILVKDGEPEGTRIREKVYIRGICRISDEDRSRKILMKEGEEATCRAELPQTLKAPVEKGQKIGTVRYYLEGELLASYPVYAEKTVKKISFMWYADKVFHDYFH